MKVKKKVIKSRSPMPPPSQTHVDRKKESKRRACRDWRYE
jgi:hypothetical protein